MSDVLIRTEGHAGRITLNRPQALNALTPDMVATIADAAERWRDDPRVRLVLIDAAGDRAFCAGGDIRLVYETARRGDFAAARRFWREEYRLNVAIANYPKPWVALCHGYVLGGGVGVAAHGSHRIVCESSRVAMPECAIGLIPDVGGSLLLAKAPGQLGEYLGLTGHRMRPGDAIYAGFADHFAPQDNWTALTERLTKTGDPAVIDEFKTAPPVAELASRQPEIDAAFSTPDLATLLARLAPDAWGQEVLETLGRNSPLSMACTLELVRAARKDMDIEAAISREYRFCWRSASEGDHLEGIRAAVIDKAHAPLWRHAIDEVPQADIAAMLAPLGPDDWTRADPQHD